MDEQVYTQISKVLSGEATDTEQTTFGEWLAASPEHRALFEEAKHFWDASGRALQRTQYDFVPALADFLSRTQRENTTARTISLGRWLAYCAGAAAALVAGFFLFTGQPRAAATVIAAAETMIHRLPDKSAVWLKKGAELRYTAEDFAQSRTLDLKGTAFFEVVPDKEHAFTVSAGAVTVTVLGTSFEVAAEKAQEVSVAVRSGTVKMSGLEGNGELVLHAGRTGILAGGNLMEMQSAAGEPGWMEELLRFRNKPLKDIVQTIATYKKADIRFHTDFPEIAKAQKVSISFRDQSLEDMLRELCLVADCTWSRGGKGFVLRQKR